MSVEYTFEGETAHSAGAPWRGRSALDAVELMSVGWQYRREHLRLSQRSHSVITNGGDQPNVVPRNASIWFYFREIDQPHIKELWEIGNKMAEGAALMTNTKWTSRILGTAYPQHMNKIGGRDDVREHQDGRPADVERSGPDAGQGRCRRNSATRRSDGLAVKLGELGKPVQARGQQRRRLGRHRRHLVEHADRHAALSRRTSPGCPATTGRARIASATPIAHKGVVAGAKVQAMTVLDLLTKPELVTQAWDYFNNVQTKDVKYIPFITKDTPPPTHLNTEILAKYREQMRKYYYDPTKYSTYLEQLGIKYPTVRQPP